MATMTDTDKKAADVRREIETMLGRVPEWVNDLPDSSLGGFWSLMRDFYMSETKVPNKYKDLIGIAVAGATRCRYCALFHTELAKLNGATDEEIAEANVAAGLTMFASTFVNGQQVDYGRFRDETLKIVEFVRTAQAKATTTSPSASRAHA